MAKKRRRAGDSGLVTAMGLMRFYEEIESKIKVPPEAVVGAAFGISVLALILRIVLG
ncbi:preprotein translocase subunit SecG [Ignicoccus islandicus DSM 13165]|uniref:Preprotein translocase subunit SecG n=1 Tax=Ignicoccus islandicus DSM 13165 TaxID=940295 RepID=A0A0U3EAK0_9CREN|nr:SEC61-beta family protein [Ignicoccus islandicus]ALU11459.1 preprotein translocase subunit SecG [Ignicoccus islandicus DSM 13165]